MVIRQLEELNIASLCEPICADLSVVSGDLTWPFLWLSVLRAGTDAARGNRGCGWDVAAAHMLSNSLGNSNAAYIFFAISLSCLYFIFL